MRSGISQWHLTKPNILLYGRRRSSGRFSTDLRLGWFTGSLGNHVQSCRIFLPKHHCRDGWDLSRRAGHDVPHEDYRTLGNWQAYTGPTFCPIKNNDVSRGRPHGPFFATVYVNEFIMARVQADPTNKSAFVASAFLAFDSIRLFGPGEADTTPILAAKRNTDWDTTVGLLGFRVNTHTLRIAVTEGKIAAIRLTLEQEWPFTRKQASAQEVLIVIGKL